MLVGRTAWELRALPFAVQEKVVSEACRQNARVVVSIRTCHGKSIIEHMAPVVEASVDDPIVLDPGRSGVRQISLVWFFAMASELAIAGIHYDIYRHSPYSFLYVCHVGNCPRNARNVKRFEPHVLEHGFSGIHHDADKRRLQTLKTGYRKRSRVPRPPRDTPSARDYAQLRVSLKTQWRQTAKRKSRHFFDEAQTSAKYRYGPKPEAWAETIFTVMIDGMLLMEKWTGSGFKADRGDYTLQERVLEKCVKTTTVYSWCCTLVDFTQLHHDGWPTEEGRPEKIKAACRALTNIFPQFYPEDTDASRSTLQDLRTTLVQSGIKHMQYVKALRDWEATCAPECVENRGALSFEAWLHRKKLPTLLRLRGNLVRRFSRQFGVPEQEVITKARLEDVVLAADCHSDVVPDSESSDSDWPSPICIISPDEPIPCEPSSPASSAGGEVQHSSDVLVTHDMAILPGVNSDSEAFHKRLDVIYVSPDGVATHGHGEG
ncbi:hypothetical protein R1sor_005320 [Riccia sorocarpa]|uniref:C2H2-type domain-containing protein n=1 Tax=Riccia sorocarpa TaxID=122646 RepID=A0ABD3HQR6_9MARC